MKIGIDARLWNESGVGRYTRNLVKHLQILDHKNEYVLFVSSKDYKEFKVQSSKLKVRIADVRWHTLEEQIKFPSIINKENIDLMHFPYFSVPVFYNKPYVVTIHDLILNHFSTGLASTLPIYIYRLKLLGYKFVIKCAAQNAKKIITVSNATKSEIIDHLGVPKDKVVVTYEGVDDKIRNPKSEIRNKSKIINTKTITDKYFLYVGNAYPHKNLDRLLEAFSLLCHTERSEGSPDVLYSASGDSSVARRPQNDIRLVLVGKEDYFYKRLKEKVKKMHLEKSVLFYREVNDEELITLYKNAKALVMPSLMEGFGLPGLEAMANKCLVLASDILSLREIYGNAAVYFDPYDPKDIAEKMREAYFNDLNHFNSPYAQSFPRSFDKLRMVSIVEPKRESSPRSSRGPIRSGMTKLRNMSHFSRQIGIGLERAKMFSWEKMARETLRIYESCG